MIWEHRDAAWQRNLKALAAYQRQHGDTLVPQRYEHEGIRLGAWVSQMRAGTQPERSPPSGSPISNRPAWCGATTSTGYANARCLPQRPGTANTATSTCPPAPDTKASPWGPGSPGSAELTPQANSPGTLSMP
ncbi:helicase associated domain-containing protein [Streptomyces lydicus]|uniref:helicase associated domain-containing protein n=1 Tax=Streptomyces lydicus TaxID=47763 RepID=UPI0037B4A441